MEKQIKPHRNLFAPTIAQKNKHLTATALLPNDKYYRTYLEPYLNDVVYIECPRWYIKPDFRLWQGFANPFPSALHS